MDFIRITIIDVIDIFAIAILMYYLYKFTRGTQAPSILSGVVAIYLLWIVVKALNMEMLSAVLGHIIGVGVVALIVVFQPEIRRFLQVLGSRNRKRRGAFFAKLFDFKDTKTADIDYLEALASACGDMAATKTGALIVIEQEVDLGWVSETGIPIDAMITSPLLKNIFFKNSPLHDGAAVVMDGRLHAAKCILPSTQNEVPVSFGMRHRAAIGISEVSDAVVVVVSEETGGISIAQDGQIKVGIAPAALQDELKAVLESQSK